MTPNLVQNNYWHFQNYKYRLFSCALIRFRESFKNQQQNWAEILDGCDQAIFIFILTVIVMVACFDDSPTTCILLFLTRLQAWGRKTPQILTTLRRTATMKHGYMAYHKCCIAITMKMGKGMIINMSNHGTMRVLERGG